MGLQIGRTIVRYLPPPPLLPEEAPELYALSQYVRTGRCILFVGAGLSAGAGLPTWVELMKRLVKRNTRWGISEGVVPDHISIIDDDEVAMRQSSVMAVRREMGDKNFTFSTTRFACASYGYPDHLQPGNQPYPLGVDPHTSKTDVLTPCRMEVTRFHQRYCPWLPCIE